MTELGPLLQVDGLTIRVGTAPQPLVDGVSFELNPGETLCIVGESGCGKSLTALALMGLLDGTPLRIEFKDGSNPFEGRKAKPLTEREMNKARREKRFRRRKFGADTKGTSS